MSIRGKIARARVKVRQISRERQEKGDYNSKMKRNAESKRISSMEKRAAERERKADMLEKQRKLDARLATAKAREKKARKPSMLAKGAKSAGKGVLKYIESRTGRKF